VYNLVPECVPPWLNRATNFKEEYNLNVELKKQVDSLNEEIMVLAADVNSKHQNQIESALRIEVLEKRLKNSKVQVIATFILYSTRYLTWRI
jgi:hypothetical protein